MKDMDIIRVRSGRAVDDYWYVHLLRNGEAICQYGPFQTEAEAITVRGQVMAAARRAAERCGGKFHPHAQ